MLAKSPTDYANDVADVILAWDAKSPLTLSPEEQVTIQEAFRELRGRADTIQKAFRELRGRAEDHEGDAPDRV